MMHEQPSSSKEKEQSTHWGGTIEQLRALCSLIGGCREVGIRLLKLEIPNVRPVFVRSFDPMKIDWYRARVDFTAVTCAYE